MDWSRCRPERIRMILPIDRAAVFHRFDANTSAPALANNRPYPRIKRIGAICCLFHSLPCVEGILGGFPLRDALA